MRLFVDTCVWRHWLTLRNSRPFDNQLLKEHARTFDEIYGIVSSRSLGHVFLYNARVERELTDIYLKDLPVSFCTIKANGYFEKVPIHLSRADGTDKLDGSLLCGGRFGGTLRDLLSIDGHDHARALQSAHPDYDRENPAHTAPRRKEFDVEHLESALEGDADLFITTDQPLINRLTRALEVLASNSALVRAHEICVTPADALSRMTLI